MSLSGSGSGRTWDEASSPVAVGLARRYEAAWRGGQHPEPTDYLPREAEGRPGALLALLRADLNLRREAGEAAIVEPYLTKHQDLSSEAVVALLYEEFCLREEAGEEPDPEDYYRRFPQLLAPLRRVLGIHQLVGSGRSSGESFSMSVSLSASTEGGREPVAKLPEAGQTIGGFHLVGELGRGAFGRVFLAKERQLADRPVALKVTRRGSREPHALARLQHTHIVPVHSYRVDPATGLHLLCMPYLGRVTLAQVLADPVTLVARSGAELVEVVDRIAPRGEAGGGGSGRAELACRPFARAIAWWGARLAEALQHAHERGVLHRDVKPSNVLIAGDGLPLLVDFNLAQSPIGEGSVDEPFTAPGGTLAYMAPEQLDALARGDADGVDARCDVYALGVVLYEALASSRPFAPPTGALSVEEALQRAAAERREGAEPLRRDHPEVPPALEAVVLRCLEPDPRLRYASARQLADDLQAVAEDGPLFHAREPQPARTLRWVRRRRRPLGAIAFAAVTVAVVVSALSEGLHSRRNRVDEVRRQVEAGEEAEGRGEFTLAATLYEAADRLARTAAGPVVVGHDATALRSRAARKAAAAQQARTLVDRAEPLKFRLLGIEGSPTAAVAELREVLAPFGVLERPDWWGRPPATDLEPSPRDRLTAAVDQLLYLYVLGEDGRDEAAGVLALVGICDRALAFTQAPGPWRAERARLLAKVDPRAPRSLSGEGTAEESSARTCLKWGLFFGMVKQPDRAMAWLERAARIEPDDYWSRFILARYYAESGRIDEALKHCEVAVALEPASPWARLNRADLLARRGTWGQAQDDLERAIASARSLDLGLGEGWLHLGILRRKLGDFAGAQTAFLDAMAGEPGPALTRTLRWNLAELDRCRGCYRRALEQYDALRRADDSDEVARRAQLGEAEVALALGQDVEAEARLADLASDTVGKGWPEVWFRRAEARLRLGRPGEALADAEMASRLRPGPGVDRLLDRARLAAHPDAPPRLDRPEVLAGWPVGGAFLAADLRASVNRLDGASTTAALLDRAVALAVLGRREEAAESANRGLAQGTESASSLIRRARVRRWIGDHAGARDDVAHAGRIEPDTPSFLELRGELAMDRGDAAGAVVDLELAARKGAGPASWSSLAGALASLGRDRDAVEAWSAALAGDPDDRLAELGRARSLARLHRTDAALADLEVAATDPAQLPGVLVTYFTLLKDRPDRLPRVWNLTGQWIATGPTRDFRFFDLRPLVALLVR